MLHVNKDYADGVILLSDTLGEWIVRRKAEGVIEPSLPPLVVVHPCTRLVIPS